MCVCVCVCVCVAGIGMEAKLKVEGKKGEKKIPKQFIEAEGQMDRKG